MVVVFEGILIFSVSVYQNDFFNFEVFMQVVDEVCEVLDVVVKGGIFLFRVGVLYMQFLDGVFRRESGLQMCKICCVGFSCQVMDEDQGVGRGERFGFICGKVGIVGVVSGFGCEWVNDDFEGGYC